MQIDTHCHLNFRIFNENYNEIIKDTLKKETWMIIAGTNLTNSKRACEIAMQYEKGVFASVGLHPVHLEKQEIVEENIKFTTTGEAFEKDKFKELIFNTLKECPLAPDFTGKHKSCGRVVAIGETGLDYFFIKETDPIKKKIITDKQKRVFTEHLKLAEELRLPVIIHARGEKNNPYEVYNHLIEILEVQRIKFAEGIKGVIHAFNGTLTQAKQFINMGLLIGINGQIFNNHKLTEFLKDIPLEKIVMETDSPFYLSKETLDQPNLPINVTLIAKELTQKYSKSIYEIQQITTQNALNLFNLTT